MRRERLAALAGYVLRGNDRGTMTAAAPALYPHQWSWDAAFVAVGLASVNVPRAATELDSLLAAQWRTGMIPHIVFSDDDEGYFPGPQRWGTQEAAAAPEGVRTSGICQPPVHAIAVRRIVDAGRRLGGAEEGTAEALCARAWPQLLSWHRWLGTARDPEGTGRVTIHHGWESGMDNSPRWDGPYSRVQVGSDLPPYTRKDTQVVADASQRPSDREYDRYLWLVEEMRRVGYDDARVRQVASFAAEDVLLTAILALASDVLAELGQETGQPAEEVAELVAVAHRCRRGVAASIDRETGLARDRDLRTGEWLATETIAGFAPLLCGAGDHEQQRRLLELLDGPQWCGHPALAAAVPPSTSPESADFRAREYWRGPQWPVTSWLFSWTFARQGWTDRAAALREESLRQLSEGSFGEYYEPFTGEPLGSAHQSWTAAVALDWLCWPEP